MHNTAVACLKHFKTLSDRLKKQREEVRFRVLRLIESKPEISQRELAEELGISLGQINYQVRALKNKGMVKISNFLGSDNKMAYSYILTPKGISEKLASTYSFLESKRLEFEILKAEIEKLERETSHVLKRNKND